MSYHIIFHETEEESLERQQRHQHQHCMRCHKAFDPEKNSDTACVLLTPHTFMGKHTTNAKEVDYLKFHICHPTKCGKVLHSFTLHLRLIQAEKESHELEVELNRQEEQFGKILEDQLEFLQKIKMRRNKMTTEEKSQLNPKRVQAIDQQYKEVVEMMIQKEAQKMDLETWTRDVLNPIYQEKERKLFLRAPKAEPKARKRWARIELVAKKGDHPKYHVDFKAAGDATTTTTTTGPTSNNNVPLETIDIEMSDATLKTIRE